MPMSSSLWGISGGLCSLLILICCTMTEFQSTIVVQAARQRKVDQCAGGRADCHADAVCLSKRRAYRCRCKAGFYGNGKICVDEKECDFENGGCVHFCSNTHGSYKCSCRDGFILDRDGRNCVDDNECLSERGGCAHQCVNTLGSYQCKCNAGYSLASDGRSCQAGRYCQDRLGCAHHCQRSSSGHLTCACRRGYRLGENGKDCIPRCDVGNGGCQHLCSDGQTAPKCSCADKYVLSADLKSCMVTCGVNNGGCDKKCEDTKDGPRCTCPAGFILHQDRRKCLDVNECLKENGGCSHDCINTHGSYECTCPRGYKVQQDHMTCTDVDECKSNNTCDHICENTHGSFSCDCNLGYERYGETHCADKNECSVNNGGCEQVCNNTQGSYQCACHEGYKLHHNRRDCVEMSKCLPLQTPAKADLSCHKSEFGETCQLKCHTNAHLLDSDGAHYTLRCGPSTGFLWTHEKNNKTLPSCSESVSAPSFKRKAEFSFLASECSVKKRSIDDFQENLNRALKVGEKYSCKGRCKVTFVKLECGSSGRKGKHRRRGLARRKNKELIIAEFEVQIVPKKPSAKCNVDCRRQKAERRLKKMIKNIRKSINNQQFYVRFEGVDYGVAKKSLRASKVQEVCDTGQVQVNKKCVACSIGSYFETGSNKCVTCAAGTYQDKEGQLSCKPCPYQEKGVGIPGASSAAQCEGLCKPGYHSETGFRPCLKCPIGKYQPNFGKTTCLECGDRISTRREASTSFQDCLVRERCRPGHYFNKKLQKCIPCEANKYQPEYGQDYCIDCPGDTKTDSDGAIQSTDCKDRKCGGDIGKHQGFIQSPNWPGDYPNDVECTWEINPQDGRRILIVIPEIFLASDSCEDSLVMRKSASPYSVSTYETCKSTEQPIAFTARSRKLWIKFKSDGRNTAKGFSIPYVAYDEEYQDLIEDIVRDGRLYSSYQNQEVLKDRKLLSALLDVIVHPYNYFKYYNVSTSMFPESFIRLLRKKVQRFFKYD